MNNTQYLKDCRTVLDTQNTVKTHYLGCDLVHPWCMASRLLSIIEARNREMYRRLHLAQREMVFTPYKRAYREGQIEILKELLDG